MLNLNYEFKLQKRFDFTKQEQFMRKCEKFVTEYFTKIKPKPLQTGQLPWYQRSWIAIKTFADTTTIHGLRTSVVGNLLCRALWSVIFLTSFTICMTLVAQSIIKFRNYDTTTTVMLSNQLIPFPAVTICNLNAYKKSLYGAVPEFAYLESVMNSGANLQSGPAQAKRKKRDDEHVPNIMHWSNGTTVSNIVDVQSRDYNTEIRHKRQATVYQTCMTSMDPHIGITAVANGISSNLCYQIHNSNGSWSNNFAFCQNLGGQMIHFPTEASFWAYSALVNAAAKSTWISIQHSASTSFSAYYTYKDGGTQCTTNHLSSWIAAPIDPVLDGNVNVAIGYLRVDPTTHQIMDEASSTGPYAFGCVYASTAVDPCTFVAPIYPYAPALYSDGYTLCASQIGSNDVYFTQRQYGGLTRGVCYKLYHEKYHANNQPANSEASGLHFSFTTAMIFCAKRGGTLAYFYTRADYTAVRTMVQTVHESLLMTGPAWIALTHDDGYIDWSHHRWAVANGTTGAVSKCYYDMATVGNIFFNSLDFTPNTQDTAMQYYIIQPSAYKMTSFNDQIAGIIAPVCVFEQYPFTSYGQFDLCGSQGLNSPPANCTDAGTIANGTVNYMPATVGYHTSGTWASISCNASLGAFPTTSIYCYNGVWSPVLSTISCVIICPDYNFTMGTVVYNGGVFNSRPQGTIATLSCNGTSIPSGSTFVQCDANSNWIYPTTAPVCLNVSNETYANVAAIQQTITEVANSSQALQEALLDVAAYFAAGQLTTFMQSLGHPLNEMIPQCSYNGRKCGSADFTSYLDPDFGNCFQFNNDEAALSYAGYAGPSHGLTMVVAINQSEYATTTERAGVAIVLHRQQETVVANSMANFVGMGYETHLTAMFSQQTKLAYPYGDCVTKGSDEIPFFYSTKYTQEGCYRSCYQKLLIDQCTCGDPRLPLPNSNVKYCSTTTKNCVKAFAEENTAETLAVKCNCPEACQYITYTVEVTQSTWPTYNAMPAECRGAPIALQGACLALYRQNYGKIKVFLKRLEFLSIEETPQYPLVSLFSDFGGLFGLYLGMSVISFAELFVLLGSIIKYLKARNIAAYDNPDDYERTGPSNFCF